MPSLKTSAYYCQNSITSFRRAVEIIPGANGASRFSHTGKGEKIEMITRIGFVSIFAFLTLLTIISARYNTTSIGAHMSPVQDPAASGSRCSIELRADRCTRSTGGNQRPEIRAIVSKSEIVLPCPETKSSASCSSGDNQRVQLQTCALDKDFDKLLYTYASSGGRITGDGQEVTWDLRGVQPGTYSTSVEVDDGCGCVSYTSVEVAVKECLDCK
jgi:hypothetical protein